MPNRKRPVRRGGREQLSGDTVSPDGNGRANRADGNGPPDYCRAPADCESEGLQNEPEGTLLT